MPDVPERCPLCDSETLYTGVNLYHACGTRSTPEGAVIMEGWECAVRQRDAARAEAERYREQYEALRAGVERVACQVQYKSALSWDEWYEREDLLERGRALGLEQAEQILRALFDEAGGVKRD